MRRRLTLNIQSGNHVRRDCPISVPWPEELEGGNWRLRNKNGSLTPLQISPAGSAFFVLKRLSPSLDRTYELYREGDGARPNDTKSAGRAGAGVSISQDEPETLTVRLNGALLTQYRYGNDLPRPCFYPLLGPHGVPITRSYPLAVALQPEATDHPHHTSLWIAHGEVSGVDNWSVEPGHGFTRHLSTDLVEQGPVYGRFRTTSEWRASDGRPILNQLLEVIAWATRSPLRLVDVSVTLRADKEDVLLGDTKEGGIVSLRVADELTVLQGGQIENVYGAINEDEAWGKSAHWCDYSGMVGGRHLGVAVMDHPQSFRYPTHWHVRNYGLMTANPFGYSAFSKGLRAGSHLLRKGDRVEFRYRLALHTGSPRAAGLPVHYLNFVSPPVVQIS
ncbi:MAG TPA: PmoA family protein [Chthonomonadales bacterium]|nr:PmoA family protein [Chthonomonadales bacterium]